MDANFVSALTSFFPYLAPEMILGIAACVLFLGGTCRADRRLWGGVALVALLAAGVVLWLQPLPHYLDKDSADAVRYASPLMLDRLALFLRAVSIAGGIILVLFSWDAMPANQSADYHACLLLIVVGMGLTGAANELVTLFLALELTSIPTYVILYLGRSTLPGGGLDSAGQEAAMKYFMLSIFSSALTLFGFSYLYGLSGTTNLPALADAFRAGQLAAVAENPAASSLMGLGMIALVMVVAGLGFRITAVPFHFYAPDVYQGTTMAGAALLAFVPKMAGFAALVRVLGFVFPVLSHDVFEATLSPPVLGDQLPVLLWIMAAVTMTLGNILGLLQDNLRRLLAYSSVAHAGYMLIGLAVAPKLRPEAMVDGVDAVFFYMVSYGAMTIGAFGVLQYLNTRGQRAETMDDVAGLGRSRPGMALLMVLFLFSLIGIPLTAGFMGKFLLFAGALDVPANPDAVASLEQRNLFLILALIAAINAAIGAWYYLRIAATMYLREPPPSTLGFVDKGPRSWPVLAAVWLCAVLTLGIGIYPAPLKKAVQSAVPRFTEPAPQTAAVQP
ncbi:MAG TPA: NADH-quinone oxidoreductase subunit N [Gemmataceae bacterium]|nr:NADH-quinone oxidoreductase subunit N [Gemmataceae bacterium]